MHLAEAHAKTWKKIKGSLNLLLIGRQTFIRTFSVTTDKWIALLHGPCRIFGHLISLRPWIKRFNPSKHINEATVPVWIRLPDVSVEFFDHRILVGVGNTLGCFLGADAVTHNLNKATFTRICTLIDIAKDLPSEVIIDGLPQQVIYEGNLGICRKCGCSNHSAATCSLPAATATIPPRPNRGKTTKSIPNSNSKSKNLGAYRTNLQPQHRPKHISNNHLDSSDPASPCVGKRFTHNIPRFEKGKHISISVSPLLKRSYLSFLWKGTNIHRQIICNLETLNPTTFYLPITRFPRHRYPTLSPWTGPCYHPICTIDWTLGHYTCRHNTISLSLFFGFDCVLSNAQNPISCH